MRPRPGLPWLGLACTWPTPAPGPHLACTCRLACTCSLPRVYWLVVAWLVGWTPYACLALAQVRDHQAKHRGAARATSALKFSYCATKSLNTELLNFQFCCPNALWENEYYEMLHKKWRLRSFA